MQYYETLLAALDSYFAHDSHWKELFLHGGCYWFASTLQQRITPSTLYINRATEHCALYFDHGLYDIRGKISPYGFHPASEREISFMTKNYKPKFDVATLCNCLQQDGIL
ncbi:MAG: hypothetical protein K6G23_07620 [Lachnospiraceae bacterium]|nr:hypothetical protein [Lachnospiraceae bacterium]